MDQVVIGAITAVWHDDSDRARVWFETIGLACQELATDEEAGWEEFRAILRTTAASASFDDYPVDGFLDYLTANAGDPLAAAQELGDAGQLDTVVGIYDQAVVDYAEPAATDEPAEADAADQEIVLGSDSVEFDQDVWFAYLKQWDGGWDGTEETWPDFVAGFRHHAPDGSRLMAEQFVGQLEELATPQRVTGLADFGITVTSQTLAEAVHEVAPELAEAEPVAAEATDEPVQPVVAEAAEAEDTEGTEAEAGEIDVAEHVDSFATDIVTPALADLFAEMPEAAQLPPERLRELLAEVLDEELAGAPAGV